MNRSVRADRSRFVGIEPREQRLGEDNRRTPQRRQRERVCDRTAVQRNFLENRHRDPARPRDRLEPLQDGAVADRPAANQEPEYVRVACTPRDQHDGQSRRREPVERTSSRAANGNRHSGIQNPQTPRARRPMNDR